jgi:phosphoribosylaminoimidazolecarboxamide formyltransferase/IMP cyclohydrolase
LKRAKDAGHAVKGSVAYSDSFFPFADGPVALAKAGVKAIFATRGSVNDDKIAEALKKAGVIFYSLPDPEARGFYAH